MYIKNKRKILGLIDNICELIEFVYNSKNIEMLDDVKIALDSISRSIGVEDYDVNEVMSQLLVCNEYLNKLVNFGEKADFDDYNELISQISILEQIIELNIKGKLNVVFLPYNITMWDSLESIYQACSEDEECIARVVPIPFFDISQDTPVAHYHFDKYDQSINLVHFSNFKLEEEEPDIVYVHNIYDDLNTLTSVLPDYYTENLKKYSDFLVYSPYATPNFYKQFNGLKNTSYTFDIGRGFVDKYISAGDFVKNEGRASGIPDNKIVNLGSPKFDALLKQIEVEHDYPEKWLKNKDKRVVVVATGISYFIKKNNPKIDRIANACNSIQELTRIFTTFKNNDIFVIWRPHPLTRNFISKVNPEILGWYDNLIDELNEESGLITKTYSNVALDTSESYIPAFKFSDALFSDGSSIIYSYLLLNKKLLFYNSGINFKKTGIELNKDKISLLLEDDGDIYDKIVDFKKCGPVEVDSKFLSKFYKNLDGTAGEKIHKAIKNDFIKEIINKQF